VISVILITNIMFISPSVSGPMWHVTAGVFYRTEATSHKMVPGIGKRYPVGRDQPECTARHGSRA